LFARNAALLAAAQAVEHYEMSRYGTLIAWANKLGLPKAAEATDEALTELADTVINAQAESREAAE
jgi:ferritin-like metal-binding protein YciE